MNEKEKELKAFNQCADALSALDNKSIFKVFQLLSVHFEFVPTNLMGNKSSESSPPNQNAHIPVVNDVLQIQERVPAKAEDVSNKPKKKGSSKTSPTFLVNLDFSPSGKESLEAFYKKFKISSSQERNLIFIYYLQEIMMEQVISANHVFSCYKHLRLKMPSFPQTLNDTKRLKGWIETANYNDLKTTRNGSNYLEHEKTFRNEALI